LNAKRKSTGRPRPTAAEKITARRVRSANAYELVYPRSVSQRAGDMAEVRKMIAAGELDVAEDELRWLAGGCPVLLEAHKLLGQIAAGDRNWELAQAHYAYAYELGLEAAKLVRPPATLPYARQSNREVHEAGRGLAECLVKHGQRELARAVIKQLLAWDPSDPRGVTSLADSG